MNHVARLDEHPIDPSPIDGVDINGLAGYHVGAQRDQIMKNTALYRSKGDLFKRDAQSSNTDPRNQLHSQ